MSRLKLRFHLYMYMYISISYQDRLEDMKCFHSYVCMCVIRLGHYQERFRRIMHTSYGFRHSVAPLITYLHMVDTNAQQTNGSTVLSYASICTCTCMCAYPYHIKTGLNIGSVSIHTYACSLSIWVTSRSDSGG